MAANHGRLTVVIINANDISSSTNTAEMTDDDEMHDVTCFGAVRKAYLAGLGDGKFTIGGVHNSGSTGPRKILKGIKVTQKTTGLTVPFLYRPEGTGVGKAQSSVGVFVMNYTDTSNVADVYRWKATLQMSGALDETDQV